MGSLSVEKEEEVPPPPPGFRPLEAPPEDMTPPPPPGFREIDASEVESLVKAKRASPAREPSLDSQIAGALDAGLRSIPGVGSGLTGARDAIAGMFRPSESLRKDVEAQASRPPQRFGEEESQVPPAEDTLLPAYIHRGFNRTMRDAQAGRAAIGELSPEEAANNYVYYEQEAKKYAYDPDVAEALREYPVNAEGPVEVLSWMWNNPRATATMFGDNLAAVAVGAAIPIAAGTAASPLGPGASALTFAGTAGITSGLMTAMSAISEEMQDSGINIDSPEQVKNAFASEEFMAKATKRAILHGVPVGIMDMITGLAGAKGVGGKIVDGVWRQFTKSAEGDAIKSTVKRAIAETGVNTAMDMGGALVGEFGGQLASTGTYSWGQLIPEAAFEFPGSVVQGGYETYLASKGSRFTPADEALLRQLASGQSPDSGETPATPPILDAEEAASAGRTFYGFAEPGKPVKVTTDYARAEREMGAGDARRGLLIAVRPEEVEVSINDIVKKIVSLGDPQKVIAEATASVPEASKPAATAAMQKVLESKKPKERESAFNEARALGVRIPIPPGTAAGVYLGPLEGQIITPRLDQALRFGGTSVNMTKDPTTGQMTEGHILGSRISDPMDIDGRKLFQILKGKAFIAPERVTQAVKTWGRKAIEPMVQIRDEGLREQVFGTSGSVVDEVVWKQAVRDGQVIFNPDSRLFTDTSLIRVIDSTRDEIKAAIKASEIKAPRGSERLTWQKKFTGTSPEAHVNYDPLKPDRQYFANLANPGEVEVLEFHAGTPKLKQQAAMVTDMVRRLQKEFNLDTRLVLVISEQNKVSRKAIEAQYPGSFYGSTNNLGSHAALGNNLYVIEVKLDRSDVGLYHTVTHEFGHHLSAARFSQADVKTRAKIFAAYRRWLEQLPPPHKTRSMKPIRRAYSALAVSRSQNNYYNDPNVFFNFEEWFAEQVARWASTKAKPLGRVSRFFKNLARDIIKMVRETRALAKTEGWNEQYTAEVEIEEFLAALQEGPHQNKWGEVAEVEFSELTAEKNRPYLGEDTVPLHVASTMTADILADAVNEIPQVNPSTVASINAHNDRFNWFYDLGLSIRQVALRNMGPTGPNPLLAPLYRYLEYIDQAKLESNKIMGEADQILLKSRNLKGKVNGKSMSDQLSYFIDDLNNMVYLSPNERALGVRRHPSPAEFIALARKYQLSQEAMMLYEEIRGFFEGAIERFYKLDMLEALKLSNQQAQRKAVREANARKAEMLKAPYFPKTRYGNWAVTVRDANGKVVNFELFESKRMQKQGQILAEKNKAPGETVTVSQLPKDAEPFVGIPPWLLDKINNLPGLTQLQKEWVEQLRYHLAPERSFAKHFLRRKDTPGYSLDWRRSFANYAFHHARNHSRLKYGELARKETEKLLGREEERQTPFLSRVGNMMADHYKEFVNPSRDWAVLRSITALFHLGFSPATAMMNLSQVPLVTAPFLADKFSDSGAMKALMKAATDLKTYYRKGSLAQQTGVMFKALNEAVRQGIIDESQAWQLASMSGGSKSAFKQGVREAWLWTTAKGMFAFAMAEQWNRRVSFRAAFDLAYQNPTAQWVQNLRFSHAIELNDLTTIQGTWTEREALAFLAAKETVLQTQFAYDKMERPKFMRGRKANLFAFYMFTQNMLFTMWNNPGMAARYMLAMAFLAGPMGLVPDDIEDILNAVARQLFGKDFNLERYARGLVVDMIGETPPGEEPKIAPDLLLHGISRYSYGIPWLASQVGADWLPNVDRSKSITLNRVMPMGGFTSLLRPSADVNQSVYNATQDAAGAAFGPGLAVYKALSQSDLSLFDMRNWQVAMPRAAKSITEAWRNYANSGQIDRKGRMQVPYDRNDPQHMAELIATALGYQPTRKSQFYDRQSAIYEVDQYWTTRRTQLLQDAFTDRFDSGEPDAWHDALAAIREYNKVATQVDKKYAITRETIERSFKSKQQRRKELEKGIPVGTTPGVAGSVGALYPETNVLFEKRVK